MKLSVKIALYLVSFTRGPFIYCVITFLGFLDPPPLLRQHVFSAKNKQKYAFSDPPPFPPTSADVIYEWSGQPGGPWTEQEIDIVRAKVLMHYLTSTSDQ